MKTRTMICVVVSMGLLVVFLGATYVWAGPTLARLAGVSLPSLMNYQGVLSHPITGDPVPDGEHEITFALYDVASGGTALWMETQAVPVQNGLFSVLLGSINPLSADAFTGMTYLGVKVGADAEMTPRQQIVSVPYAIHAQQAASAPFSGPDFDSGWQYVQEGSTKTITHGLGGDSEKYVVDMTFRDYIFGSGIHQSTYGSDVRPGDSGKGMYWEDLTTTSIGVVRMSDDVRCQEVRIRIWVYE